MKNQLCQTSSLAACALLGLATTGPATAASLYSVTEIGTFDIYTEGAGINNFGQVVGYLYTANGDQHAFLYSNNKLQDLGALPGGSFSVAFSINDKGQVVGTSQVANRQQHAFLYSSGKLNGFGSRAFLYSDGKLQNLGTLPGSNYSYARGLNNEGQVVGFSTTYSGVQQAFLYSDGKLQNLSSLIDSKYGVTLAQAVGINDRGQILANGYGDSSDNTYILTPESPTPVSENTSSLGTYTLAFGFIGAFSLRFSAIIEYLLNIKIGKFLQSFRER